MKMCRSIKSMKESKIVREHGAENFYLPDFVGRQSGQKKLFRPQDVRADFAI